MNLNTKDIVLVKFPDNNVGVGYVDAVKDDLVTVIGIFVTLNPSPWPTKSHPPLCYRWEVERSRCSPLVAK